MRCPGSGCAPRSTAQNTRPKAALRTAEGGGNEALSRDKSLSQSVCAGEREVQARPPNSTGGWGMVLGMGQLSARTPWNMGGQTLETPAAPFSVSRRGAELVSISLEASALASTRREARHPPFPHACQPLPPRRPSVGLRAWLFHFLPTVLPGFFFFLLRIGLPVCTARLVWFSVHTCIHPSANVITT